MRLFATAVLAATLAGCVWSSTYERKDAEARELYQSWEDESAQRAVCQEQLARTTKDLKAQADQLAADVAALKEQVRANEGTLTQKEAELRAVREKGAECQALVDELSKSKKKLEVAKAELERKSGEYEQLATALRGEIDAGRIELQELRGRTTVKMKDRVLFASGSAVIGAEGREALRKVAAALREMQGKLVRVEGHTDNLPTNPGGAFASNWELSAARALAVVRFLQETGLDPTRLSGSGFGEFQPIAATDTPAGRSLNRRIEIVLVPVEGAGSIPERKAVAPDARPDATKT